ncbi:MAG: cadherin-like beta sandwich domain-containing protein [Clostridia bacterium]|nr:cadherin-like beta sandwich domain-containing protein [Clostridia bacterium]
MKKRILSLIIIALVFVLNANLVFAGWADLTDEQSDQQAQEQIKEQEKEHNITEVKSSDNFLTSLQVEGYTLTPDFDKQTLEYTIKEEINKKEINIKAIASNEKATITGIDTVKVEENKNEYRVDVTAENGTVRTYIIKLKEAQDKKIENEVETETIGAITTDTENKQEEKIEDKTSNSMMYIILGVAAFVLAALVLLSRKNNKKRKRRKH